MYDELAVAAGADVRNGIIMHARPAAVAAQLLRKTLDSWMAGDGGIVSILQHGCFEVEGVWDSEAVYCVIDEKETSVDDSVCLIGAGVVGLEKLRHDRVSDVCTPHSLEEVEIRKGLRVEHRAQQDLEVWTAGQRIRNRVITSWLALDVQV